MDLPLFGLAHFGVVSISRLGLGLGSPWQSFCEVEVSGKALEAAEAKAMLLYLEAGKLEADLNGA